MTADAREARSKIGSFLERVRTTGAAGAILGGADLPETLVFEAVALAFPEARVVHVDGDTPLSPERVTADILGSFAPGKVLLVTLTFRSDLAIFKPLEKLLADGGLDVPGPTGWRPARPPGTWRLVIHSKPGSFPFDERVDLRLNLGGEQQMEG